MGRPAGFPRRHIAPGLHVLYLQSQDAPESALVLSTHSRAWIQPRSSSFVVTKTRSSGVPHCRN